jgi:hypothetical protein
MMDIKHPHIPNRRANSEIEDAVREGRVTANLGDYGDTLNTLSRRGVPKAVIERIFVYRQCCRATDSVPGGATSGSSTAVK